MNFYFCDKKSAKHARNVFRMHGYLDTEMKEISVGEWVVQVRTE